MEWPFLDLHCAQVTEAFAFEEGKRSEFAQLLEINLKHVWVPAPHSDTTNGRRPCLCCQHCLPNLHADLTYKRVSLQRTRHFSPKAPNAMSKNSSLMNVLRDYAESSSVHGIAYVFSRSLPGLDRLLWLYCTISWYFDALCSRLI